MIGIHTLQPNVTRAEALQHFTGGTFKVAGWFHGPVRSIAELYIPFRLFDVKIRDSGKEESRIFGLDATQGILDLYQFPAAPVRDDLVSVQTRNVLAATLDANEARERVLAKVRRLVFTRGFFRMRDVKFEVSEIPGEIYVPYWICFRGPDGQLRISVLDAVRRRAEGGKVRHLIEDWLRSQSSV